MIFCSLCCFSSCDKPTRLKAEAEEITAQTAAMKKEVTEMDAKLKTLGAQGTAFFSALDRQAQEALGKAEANEQLASNGKHKVTVFEISVKELRTRVDEWKAKYRK